NSLTVMRPVPFDAALTFRVHPEQVVPHRSGAQVDLVVHADVDGELGWVSRSTYLARGRTAPPPAATEAVTEPVRVVEPEGPERTVAVWRLPRDLGRRYARVSGDVNPIHLGTLRARLFGFARPIVHGMWAKARCLAAFEGRLPDTYTVDVDFKKPVL